MSNETLDGLQRFSPYAVDGGCDAYGQMEDDDLGDYVSYEDHAAEVARLTAELDEARMQAISDGCQLQEAEERSITAEAALSAAMAGVVKVRDLVWDDYPFNGEPVISMAVTQIGTYFICDDVDDFTGLYLEFISHKDATWFGTVSADRSEISHNRCIDDHSPMQAAAQADYERRILSAIQSDPDRLNALIGAAVEAAKQAEMRSIDGPS